ncbi:MAG: addiction module antidote protein, HigA family [Kangiella sp.]|nr:MAG: addiction module antidote protein, HigA family [Gammaproteobacteria bacterium]PHS13518.1 MAG: addiction module antidote protein, HigA family [Kangiella sp.]
MASFKRTRQPVHPGRIFRDDVLDELKISITRAASMLGISRKHLSKFVNEDTDCSPEMAHRLAKATNTSVASWMNMQNSLNIWREENNANNFEEIEPFDFALTV